MQRVPQGASARGIKIKSLRNKFIQTLLLVAGIIGLSTLGIVGVMSAQASAEHLRSVQQYIEEGIASKGTVLTQNHALALRGLTLDNAFLDMQRLLERAIKDDRDLVYGVYVSSERETLALARRSSSQVDSTPERDAWKKLPFNEKQYKKDFGIPKLFGEAGYTTLERTWARPTFEVNGLLSGFTGEGAKTVLPALAMAKVSMRLVPNQLPDTIAGLFESYVQKITPKTVELKITRMHGGKPWMTSFENPYVQAAGRAIERGFGRKPVFTRVAQAQRL